MIKTGIYDNLAIVLTAYLPVLFADSVGEIPIKLSAIEVIGWSVVVSCVGGAAAALRTKKKVMKAEITKVVLNTAVLGACLSMCSYEWTDSKWLIVGVCGILSLGGLSVVERVIDLFTETLSKRIKGRPNDN